MELKSLYVYLTEECNLKCKHCWQEAPQQGISRSNFLKFSNCISFFDAAVRLGLKSVTCSGGEPLLSPEFETFAKYFHEHGVSCTIETNGTLISNARSALIQRYDVYPAISLDGRTPGTHDSVRGRNGAFRLTTEGMRRLEDRGVNYEIVMAISKSNYSELVDLVQWLSDEWPNCNGFKVNPVLALGRGVSMGESDLLFSSKELVQIASEIGDLKNRFRLRPVLHLDPIFFSLEDLRDQCCCGGHCGFESSLSVLSNGTISICSLGKHFPQYSFGNVLTVDLPHIWTTHPLLQSIHSETHKRLTGVCAKCIWRRRCLGGCRALALHVYGDIFAPAPTCQRFAESSGVPISRIIGVGN